jgi:hypothetical protein
LWILNRQGYREAVLYKRFILPLAVFVGSYMPTAAQTPSAQISSTQERVAAITTTVRTVPAPLPTSSFRPSENAGSFGAPFSYRFTRTYALDPNLDSLWPMHEAKTLFLTQSTLPLLQLWGGHLWLDGFTCTLNMQNVQLGPSAAGGLLDFRPQRQAYMVGPRSVELYGVNLTFHFGRNLQAERPAPVWRSLARLVGRAPQSIDDQLIDWRPVKATGQLLGLKAASSGFRNPD